MKTNWRKYEPYKLTDEEFQAWLLDQNFNCAVCGKTFSNSFEICADHDHETGRVRGLLCRSCNGGIGLLRDDPRILEQAIVYLRKQTN